MAATGGNGGGKLGGNGGISVGIGTIIKGSGPTSQAMPHSGPMKLGYQRGSDVNICRR